MRIFISSVRRGLERERDALPGLITAIGHEPVRFEDFGARAEPSREACLTGVASSDVYLLLLGPHYGHRFHETNQSPTHDEWVAATTKGMARLVFRKSGVEVEPAQEEFAREVGSYSSGVFYAEFSTPEELQTKAAAAVLRLANEPSPLTYEPLSEPPTITWKADWEPAGHGSSTSDPAVLELHIAPLHTHHIPTRVLREAPTKIITALRNSAAVPVAAGVDVANTDSAAAIEIPQTSHHGWNEPQPASLAGVRLAGDGQLSFWSTLPRDGLGAIVDPDDLTSQLALSLRLAGAMNLLSAERFALAVGLGGSLMLTSLGTVSGVSRSSASMGSGSDQPLRLPPDESVSAAAFDRGADEVARTLATTLVEAFRRRR